jgi:hypothetical protein
MLTPKQFYKYRTSKKFIEKQRKEFKHYKKGDESWIKESTVFKAGHKSLVFIGASHVMGDHPFIRFLIKAFKKANPQFVLVEMPKDTKRENLSFQMKSRTKDTWTEIQWSTYLAKRKHIGLAGMDAENKVLLEPFLKLKDGMKVGILHWIIIIYHSNKRGFVGKALKHTEDRYALAKEMLIRDFVFPHGRFERFKRELLSLKKREYKGLSFNKMIDSVVDEMSRKYIAKKPFLELFEKERALDAPYGPWTDSTKYKINKINAYLSSYRDVCMMNECIAEMKKFDRVFAVAGSGHIDVEREILAKEILKNFGTCEVIRWKEYAKSA